MIGAIENAMLARIQQASDADLLGYRLRTVKSYAADLDERLEAEQLRNQFPAVWVVFTGWAQPVERGPRLWSTQAGWTLVVGARNLRNDRATRHGAAGEPGSYQLLVDVQALLVGQRLGLPIDPIAPGPARSLYNGDLAQQQISLYALDLTTRFDIEAALDGADPLGEFETFNANWDIPPHGNVGRELPADDSADATDRVILRDPPDPDPDPEDPDGEED